MLTERQKDILKIIVQEYIKLAKPVGSNLICDTLNCSSATIRSEMANLEDLGLLEKTHTSSGRIPSEKGYRYYVDNLMELKKMSAEDMLKLQIIFRNIFSNCANPTFEASAFFVFVHIFPNLNIDFLFQVLVILFSN